jgi:alpha-ribazole phosphatase
MKLWLARHAQPLVAPGTCYGALDVAADAQATHAAAQALAQAVPQGAWVVASPLLRCQQLAHALHRLRPDLRPHSDPRLAEMHFGVWEGVLWSDIPKAAVDAWTEDFGAHRFGGQESANAVLARVAQAWDEALRRALVHPQQVWVTHAGVIRAAQLIAQQVRQLGSADAWPKDVPAWGQWVVWEPLGSVPAAS